MKNTSGLNGSVGGSAISIGRFTYGHERIAIHQWDEGAALTIGSFCSLATGIEFFLGGNHRTDWVTTFPFGHIFAEELGGTEIKGHPATKGDIVVGSDVWIGSRASIMSGVTIGDGAIVAANSTVTRDVLPYAIVGGNPARQLRRRFDDDVIALLLQWRWWDLPLETIRRIEKELSAPPRVETLRQLIAAGGSARQ